MQPAIHGLAEVQSASLSWANVSHASVRIPPEGDRKASQDQSAEPLASWREGPMDYRQGPRRGLAATPWNLAARSPRFLRPIRGLRDENPMIHTLAIAAMH